MKDSNAYRMALKDTVVIAGAAMLHGMFEAAYRLGHKPFTFEIFLRLAANGNNGFFLLLFFFLFPFQIVPSLCAVIQCISG